MTVYIEYVLIGNYIIDYFLLKSVFMLTGKNVKRLTLVLVSVFASLISLVLPLIDINSVFLTIIKLALGGLIVLLCGNFINLREYFISLILFYFLSFALVGCVISIYSVFGVYQYNEVAVALAFIPAYYLLKGLKGVVSYLYKKRHIERLKYDIQLIKGDKIVKAVGFLDTGNCVYDKENRPVIVCDKSVMQRFLSGVEDYKSLEKITVNTATGIGQNFCIKLDKLKILTADKVNIYTNITLMTAKINVAGASVLLHPEIMESEYDNGSDNQTKKVS